MTTPTRIIDVHQHVFWHGWSDADLIANLDEQGVEKAVVLTWCITDVLDEDGYERAFNPVHGVPGRRHVGLPLSDVVTAVHRYPDRLLVGYAPDPTEPRALGWLKAAASMHDVRVCGEWKFRLGLDDPRCLEIFKFCAEAGLPVLLHMDAPYLPDPESGGQTYDPKWYGGTADNLERALQACPGTIFIGHGPGFWRYISGDADTAAAAGYPSGPVREDGRIQALLDAYPNLYAELSANSGRNAIARDVDHGKPFLERYHDRLMFGRDGLDGDLHALLQSLDLPEDVTEAIYRRNAERLFRTD